MPFKGMLKWAVAKEDHPSKSKASSKSLKKRRRLSHHHHYCSILRSGVCLRIENVAAVAAATKKIASSLSSPTEKPKPASTVAATATATTIGIASASPGKVVEDSKSCNKLINPSGNDCGKIEAGPTGASNTKTSNNNNNIINYCRGLHHSTQHSSSSSSSRFRLKLARHPNNTGKMGNSASAVVKSADNNDDHHHSSSPSRSSSAEDVQQCVTCPPGSNDNFNSILPSVHSNSSNKLNNNNTQKTNSATGTITDNAKNTSLSSDNAGGNLNNNLSWNVSKRSAFRERGKSSSSNVGGNADSKSLLYMSLDHLPLAIVKQYERMLQESSTMVKSEHLNVDLGSNGSPETLKKPVGGTKNTKLKKVQSHAASASLISQASNSKNKLQIANAIPASVSFPSVIKSRPSIIKQTESNNKNKRIESEGKLPKKITIVSPPKSKKVQAAETLQKETTLSACKTINNDHNRSSDDQHLQVTSTNGNKIKESNCSKNKNHKSSKSTTSGDVSTNHNNNSGTNVNIKQAKSRPLNVHSANDVSSNKKNIDDCSKMNTASIPVTSSKKKKQGTTEVTKRKIVSPAPINEKCTQTSLDNPKPTGRFKVTIVSSPPKVTSCTNGSANYRGACASILTPIDDDDNVKHSKSKGVRANEVERKDASCETETKHFPLKSILKDCKSSTLPRSKSEGLKPKKSKRRSSTSSNSSSSCTSTGSNQRSHQKNLVIYGRSKSFRSSGERDKSQKHPESKPVSVSPVSSKKAFHSLHNISSISTLEDKRLNIKTSFPPFSSGSTSSTSTSSTPITDFTVTSSDVDVGRGRCTISDDANATTVSTTSNTAVHFEHDTTDPQFLEKPVPISTPAVSRCAKKLTLKRSELRKLERIRTQTERLNRFLKKYYHDCLPNLPEEEEEQCSPEEKSVHLSVLRTHWIEKKPEDPSTSTSSSSSQGAEKYLQQQQKMPRQRRNTLPHIDFPTAAAIEEAAARVKLASGEGLNQNADASGKAAQFSRSNRATNKNENKDNDEVDDNVVKRQNHKNSSLLSSSAYYSDPILSSLPIIIEDPEILTNYQLQKQKQQLQDEKEEVKQHQSQKVSTVPCTRNSSCSSLLITNDTHKISTSPLTTRTLSLNNVSNIPSRRCSRSSLSSASCSCSCSSGSSISSRDSICCNNLNNTSKCSSSMMNLTNEFRMAEVIRHDNNIHESFLMSTHNFPLEDNSLLLFAEKEFRGPASRCIPTHNDAKEVELFEQALPSLLPSPNIKSHLSEKNNYEHDSCESGDENEKRRGVDNIDRFASAFAEHNNNVERATTKDCKSDNNNNNNEQGSKNKRSSGSSSSGGNNKSKKVMIPFASCNSVGSTNSRSSSCSNSNNSINSVDAESPGIIGESPDSFGPEKLKGFTMMMSGGVEEPLGNNPFDVPTSLAEDEGFMSPYPPEAYSPASSASSNASLLNRLSISSGKGSEDYDDERRLELFFLDSSCETSLMVEQQIAAYKREHQHQQQQPHSMQPDLIQIPGEKSRLVSTKQGHGCEEEEKEIKLGKGADDYDDNAEENAGMMKLISNQYRYYQMHDHPENAAQTLGSTGPCTPEQHLKASASSASPSSHIPFSSGPPKPPRSTLAIALGNSNYLQNCDENETWNSHDYATIGGEGGGCSSNASTTSGSSTSTYAACGSFFPNSNLLESHHGRQVSSDSSSSSAASLLNECENAHNHHHLHHNHIHCHHECHHHHHYEEVTSSSPSNRALFGDSDFYTNSSNACINDNNKDDENHQADENETQHDEEESVIIQSSAGNSTEGFVGIAFSTPIRPRPNHHNHQRQLISVVKNNGPHNYSYCSNNSKISGSSSFLNKSSFCSSVVSAVSNHSISMRKYHQRRYATPKKVVRKPPVKTPYSDKGEMLLRCYRNGDYVTVHVIQAKNLHVSYRSSWKLSMKISLIPEGEATFTKSESVVVPRARRFVRIDQKFSFELPEKRTKSPLPPLHQQQYTENNCSGGADVAETKSLTIHRKLFLTFLKRIEKRSTFLGWITLEVPETENSTQCWLKLRKRKMSSAAYRLSSRSTAAATSNHVLHHQSSAGSVITTATANSAPANNPPPSTIKEGGPRSGGGAPPHAAPNDATVGHSSHIENHDQGVAVPSIPSRSCKSPEYQPEYIGKTQLQNSSTMDSGVEDCCEPPPVPSIELDEKLGFRVRVNMAKAEGAGFGFSVVWVSPPRIERLEKDKTADLAGLKIGDLIIGVNGEDVTTVPNTTIYNKMKSTGMELDLEVWRKHPHVASPLPPHITSANVPQPINPAACVQPPVSGASSVPPNSKKSSVTAASADCRDHRPTSTAHNNNCTSTTLPQNSSYNNTNNVKQVATSGLPNTSGGGNGVSGGQNPLINRIQPQPPPPTSILKPPPPAPPVTSSSVVGNSCPSQSQPTTGSSAWRIRFNIELLDNEDDNLKQFFICELKFFRKVVAALDRYLIPAQANRLLTPQEIHLIFAQVIKIITMTKRILQCVANGSNSSTWKLGRILLSTHSDHLPEITSAYTAYARSLGYSAMILSEKMSIQDFAKFVLETPVPKGHLDMTSLLFAPFEHLRNLCEIGEEISHQHDNWIFLNSRLKECYADIVCETDFMEPISHVSMKKNPLLSVRDLEKRIISTTSQQPLKVCEKGRKWLFGSRLYRRENDGSWSPVWAFLFTDIIVLTSHMTRDRVFFVKETPIRLDDVVTLHFNLPKKHENEFRLLFGPDTSHHSRLDRILPLVRSKKPNQVVLRTANMQLKSLWKLLLQRQIISLNTRLSKSSSSNFSISEFCEKFPVVQHDSIMEEDEEKVEVEPTPTNANHVTKLSQSPFPTSRQTAGAQLTHNSSATHPSAAAGRTEKLQLDRFPTRKVQHAIPSSSLPVKSDTGVVGKVPSKTTSHETQQNPPSEMKQPEERVTKECQQNKRNVTVNGAPVSTSVTSPNTIPYVPDGLSSINADLMRVRVVRGGGGDRRLSFPGNGGATSFSPSNALDNEVKSVGDGSDRLNGNLVPDNSTSVIIDEKPIKVDRAVATSLETEKSRNSRPTQHDAATSTQPMPDNLISLNAVGVNYTIPPVPKARTSLSGVNANANSHTPTHSATSRTTTPAPCLDNATATAPSPIPSHNNNNTIDNASEQRKKGDETCPCANKINDKVPVENQMLHAGTGTIRPDGQITAYPSPKPRQLSNLKRLSTGSKEEGTQTPPKQPLPSKPIATSRQNDNSIKTVGNKNTPAIAPVDKAVGIATKSETHNGTVATVRHTYSKETPLERIPEALQSPVMVKRAQALASGTDTPSSSSSLSPARLPRTVKSSNSNSSDTTVNNSNKQAVLENMNSALKESVVNNAMMKSKPGSKIMTNAILKSRQQELIAQNLKTCSVNVSTETLRTEKSSDTTTASTSKTNSSTQYFSLKEESTTTSSCSVQSQTQSQSQQIMVRCVHNKNIIVHHQHHSHHCPGSCCGSGGATVNNLLITSGGGAPASPHLSVPPPRCHSENSHHPKKSKPVHTDSPIISGFGSERARRRMLVDNKLRKDYPELFGITPKDRRSFIKQLGDPDMNSKGLVAPYYYTMSPVPIPKHRMLAVGNSSNSSDVVVGSTHTWKQGNDSEKGNGNRKSSPLVIPPFNPNNSHAKGPTKSNEDNAGASCSAATTSSSAAATKSSIVSGSSKNTQRIEQPTQNPEFLPSLEDAAGSSGNGMSQSFQEPCHAPAAAGETRFQPSGMSTSNQFRSYENDQREISGKLESNRGDEDDDDDDDASGIAAQLAHDVYQASFELDEDGQRLKDFVEKMRAEMSEGGVGMEDDDDDDEEEDEEEEDDDDDEEDSDDSTAGGHEGEHEGQSHRSHEESSNDSGISDEMTEKSKTTMSGLLEEDEDHERSLTLSISRRNENFSNMLDCMRSGVLAAEVKKNPSTNPDKISSNTSTNTPTATVSNSATPHVSSNRVHANNDHTNKAPIVDDDVAGNNVVVVDNNNCCSPNNDHANKTKYNDSSATNHPSHVVCCTNSNKSHVVDGTTLCFLEGETKASMETLVVLKADKATETEDDDFNFLLAMNNRGGDSSTTSTNAHQQIIQMQQHDEKPLRSIMAERREAFFLSQQSSFSNPHCPFTSTISGSGQAAPHGHSIHFAEDFPTYTTRSQFRQQQHSNTHNNHNSCKTGYFSVGNNHNQGVSGCVNCTSDAAHPLKVKIVDGGTLQSVVDTSPNQNSANNAQSQEPCERVQLQRLERHKKAKVERVESSEDSTSSSSDLASASPAAENGTTDPSWSSSSSGSLAGYASSKEEPLIPSTCSTNNATGGSSVAMPPCATVPTSSAPSSSSPSACVVATSTCSQCSNSNNNNSHNNNHLNKDSISSVSSCSASAQTHDEPSSSCHEYENTSSKSYSLLVETDLSSLLVEEEGEETDDHDANAFAASGSSCCFRSSNNNSNILTTSNHDTCATNINNNSNNLETTCSHQATTCATHTSHSHDDMNESGVLAGSSDVNELVENNSEPDSSTSCSSISTTSNSQVPLLAPSNTKGTSTAAGNITCETSTTTSSSFSSKSSFSSSSSTVVLVVSSAEDQSGCQSSGGVAGSSTGPEIVVTQESDPEDCSSHSSNENINTRHGYSSDGEEDSIVCNGKAVDSVASDENGGGSSTGEGGGSGCSSSNRSSKGFLRVESNDSTAENYGDDDDYNFDDDDDEEDDLSHCSVATINRYGTFESLEKLESEDTVGGLPDFHRTMPRSKARFTFEDDDDDDDDLFEEDFETDFNFRFPSQIQDNTYSVSRLGPLPPLLEEDYEDEMYDETRASGVSPSSSSGMGEYSGGIGAGCSSSAASLRARHETGLRRDNSFLLARLATMYARSSISPITKILRELWLKKRYRQWQYKE